MQNGHSRFGGLFISAITVLELKMGVWLAARRDPDQGASLRAWLGKHVLPAFHDRILPTGVPLLNP